MLTGPGAVTGLDPDAATQLAAALHRATGRLAALAHLGGPHAAVLADTARDLSRRARDLEARIETAVRADILDRVHHLPDPRARAVVTALATDPDRHPRAFDPAAATVTEVVGDLATATRVAVLVPGRGTTVASLPALRQDAAALRAATGRPAATAVVVWIGYDAPGGGWSPDVVSRQAAAVGAARLRRAVASLPGRVTVIGHSYGAVVAARAAAGGLAAHDLVLLGSPGAVVSTATGYRLGPDARVWAGGAATDPVDWIERFGPNPTDLGFGATRITTGLRGLGAHAGYLHDPETLTNLGHIVAGRRDSVRAERPTRPESVADRIDGLTDTVAAGLRRRGRGAPLIDTVVGIVTGLGEIADLGHEAGRAVVAAMTPDATNPAGARRGSSGSW